MIPGGRYEYQAAAPDGSIESGEVDAIDLAEATNALIRRGLYPLQVVLAASASVGRRAAGKRDLAVAFTNIAALVDVGVPLERAVGATSMLMRGSLRDEFDAIRNRLRRGESFAQALAGAHGLIPSGVVGAVRAGERASRLAPSLQHVASQLAAEAELTARVRQALAYPIVVAATGTVSIGVIVLVVLPRFAELLADVGGRLPGSARVLLTSSNWAAQHGLVLIAMVLVTVSGAIQAGRAARWQSSRHRLLLRLPIVGRLRHTLATSRACRALAASLGAGSPILAALTAAADAAADREVAARLARVQAHVSEGRPLATAIEDERALAPAAVPLIAVGEGSGQLGTMCERAAELASAEAERSLRSAVSLLEPALIVIFGGLVAGMAGLLLQAVYGLRPG